MLSEAEQSPLLCYSMIYGKVVMYPEVLFWLGCRFLGPSVVCAGADLGAAVSSDHFPLYNRSVFN